MIIREVLIKDTLGIPFAKLALGEGPVEITGPNGSGKTSIFTAIGMVLFGASFDPEQPIRRGQDKAEVEIALGDKDPKLQGLRARLVFTRIKDGDTGGVSDKKRGYKRAISVWGDQGRISDAQSALDKITTALLFDPVHFINASGQEQIELLRASGALKLPIDLNEHDIKHDRLYEERAAAKKEADRQDQHAISLPVHPGPLEAVDTSDAMEELEAARELEGDKESLLQSVSVDHDAIQDANSKIMEYEQLIEALQVKLKRLEANEKKLKNKADKIVIPDIEALKEKVSSAGEINQKVEDNRRSGEAREQAKQALAAAKKLDAAVKANVQARKDALAKAELPYEGMDFGKDKKGNPCILIDKLPLEQINTAEQIKVAMAVLIAIKPELKCAFIHAGNDLDPQMKAMLNEIAAGAGIQPWYHMVTAPGDREIGFCMEEGLVVAENGKPVPIEKKEVEATVKPEKEEAADGLFEEKGK